ncbi:MATE family efflux transporter [Acidimangrovimonas sediminis]|uniref:MATE family efflux transporter n=1 Tax=Acidimangrovimonas sediminis TaxID=2056283 RepID=UPI000C80C6FC|nr:MATE family efflux transporter [Acidimangrovimonas sediminis]
MAGRRARFLEGNLFRHVSVMALSSSVGLIAVFLVDFVDILFIAMLGDAALTAALGYTAAVLFFTTSIGIGMAIATSALVARALGADEEEEARRKATSALIHGAVVGVAAAALVTINLWRIMGWLGASGAVRAHAVAYLSILVPSMPFLIVAMAAGAVLRAHGDARRAMLVQMVAAVVNAVLDPVFIFGLGWGLEGAAIASAIARVVMAGVALSVVHRVHRGLARPSVAQIGADLRPVLAIAGPALMTQMAAPVGQAYVTRAMAAYGPEAVAAMAIITRTAPIAFAVLFALSGAVGPVIGQNYGARQGARVARAYRDGLIFAALYTVSVSVLLYVLRAPIADLFQAQGLTRSLVYLFCGPLALLFWFNGVIFVSNAACNNLGRPLVSTLVNWGRNTLGTILPVMLLSPAMGAAGVFIGQAAGGIVFGLAAMALARAVIRDRTRGMVGRV